VAHRTGFQPSVIDQDPKAAMVWLEATLGFETAIYIDDAIGDLLHCQMHYGEDLISVGQEWDKDFNGPLGLGGKNTQITSLQIDTDVDAHCLHARGGGGHRLRAEHRVLRRSNLSLPRPGMPSLELRRDRPDGQLRRGPGAARRIREDHWMVLMALAPVESAVHG
jgi:uncharacterized glyoxalase superfamily protein PhnB